MSDIFCIIGGAIGGISGAIFYILVQYYVYRKARKDLEMVRSD